MNHILRTLGVATALTVALALGLAGCSNLGQGTTDAVRVTVGIGFETYASGYQPVLGFYSKLPYCGDPAVPPCKSRDLYRKLYNADAAVAKCAKKAQESLASESPDFALIGECVKAIEASKLIFASPLAASAIPTTPTEGTTP